jgi:hypothetical protein
VELVLKHGEVTVIDDDDYPLVAAYRWRLNCDGYAVTHRMVGSRVETVFMHRIINGTPEGKITDHIDRDKLNNRRKNLRTADHSMNSLNSKPHSRNRSGFRGVSRVGNRWRAVLTLNGRQEHLGYFDEPVEASRAYESRVAEVVSPWQSLVTA